MYQVVDYRNVYEWSTGNFKFRELAPNQGFYPPKTTGDLRRWQTRASKAGRNGKKSFRARLIDGQVFVCRII